MRKQNNGLRREISDLKHELSESNKAVNSMRSIFTEGQIRKIMSTGNIQWKWEDVSKAICLNASGPRGYHHLYKKLFPLPHISTLQRWSRKIPLNEGIIDTSLYFMSQNTELEEEDKLCVLDFDETKVAGTYEYDAQGDYMRKPSNYVLVVIARGLRKLWKQLIFIDYDCEMSTDKVRTWPALVHSF